MNQSHDQHHMPTYAPIPPSTFGPDMNERGYRLDCVGGNLYNVTAADFQATFLTTKTGVVLIDAPPSNIRQVAMAIDEATSSNGRPSKVTHMVYSHSHHDHIGGSSLFGPDVTRIAHVENDRILTRAKDSTRPRPDITFRDSYSLEVGGEKIDLFHHGSNHTVDNLFIHMPEYQTLMLVDILFPGWVPFEGLAWSADIPGWLEAHQRLLDYDWTTYIGGHMSRPGTRDDAETMLRYLDDLEASCRAAIIGVDPLPYMASYGATGDSFGLMRQYWDAIAREAAAPVIETWTGVLGGADSQTPANAFTMMMSLMHDYGVSSPLFAAPASL